MATKTSDEDTKGDQILPLVADDNQVIPADKYPPLNVFEKAIKYPAIIVPVRRTAALRNSLKGALLHQPKTKSVYNNPDDDQTRILVLSGEAALEDDRIKTLLNDGHQKTSYTITTSYADRSVEDVLRQMLPDTISELPTAFEIVGSIAHLNLRDDVLPYKFIVGKAILDKNQPRPQ